MCGYVACSQEQKPVEIVHEFTMKQRPNGVRKSVQAPGVFETCSRKHRRLSLSTFFSARQNDVTFFFSLFPPSYHHVAVLVL